ncbi:unnamed protein product [Pleuronectes platessa]|uniref:Uncharacterized protein n=1 Tax=Pleuronectes platessa TaxID=8262 RepID=A0A9N7VFS8_PLEPL|nr:unnamed protein product [Pleuronectes platessa]
MSLDADPVLGVESRRRCTRTNISADISVIATRPPDKQRHKDKDAYEVTAPVSEWSQRRCPPNLGEHNRYSLPGWIPSLGREPTV